MFDVLYKLYKFIKQVETKICTTFDATYNLCTTYHYSRQTKARSAMNEGFKRNIDANHRRSSTCSDQLQFRNLLAFELSRDAVLFNIESLVRFRRKAMLVFRLEVT